MAGWIAQDSFVGETPEGAWVTVHRGQWFPDGDPLVALDRDAADAAAKDGTSRSALFAPAPAPAEDEPPPKAAEPAPPKAAEAPKAAEPAPARRGPASRKGT